MWEAPIKEQQVTFIHRFGFNVNLGNIDPNRVLALEALRASLRFETLRTAVRKRQSTPAEGQNNNSLLGAAFFPTP